MELFLITISAVIITALIVFKLHSGIGHEGNCVEKIQNAHLRTGSPVELAEIRYIFREAVDVINKINNHDSKPIYLSLRNARTIALNGLIDSIESGLSPLDAFEKHYHAFKGEEQDSHPPKSEVDMLISLGTKTAKNELETWLKMLRTMDSDTLGMLVAGSTHIRHSLEMVYKTNMLDPFTANSADPNLSSKLRELIQKYQSEGDLSSAASVMVWLHTLRCCGLIELRPQGRELWRELRRGFPFVGAAAHEVYAATSKRPNIDGYDVIPKGFE